MKGLDPQQSPYDDPSGDREKERGDRKIPPLKNFSEPEEEDRVLYDRDRGDENGLIDSDDPSIDIDGEEWDNFDDELEENWNLDEEDPQS